MQPLQGIRVLDFSTLLPGPLATLLLAEAGAEVIKIERPGTGDDMRSYLPKFGEDAVNFAMLNRGKTSVAIDLKAPDAIARLTPLIREADILVEQFRPGTLGRLGLDYETVAAINPRLIYASVTGFGQTGPLAHAAAHDLNFCAQSGALSLAAGSDGAPVLPSLLVGDIAGGSYPAVINILLALRQRDATGKGCHLDIAMADNLFTLMYWAIGNGLAAGQWPRRGGDLTTGASPRYHIYRTADGRFLAAAPMEDKFWNNFCDLIDLPDELRDDSDDPARVIDAVATLIRAQDGDHWQARLAERDTCCTLVLTVEEAIADPHFRARGLFAHRIRAGAETISALPVPIADQFRRPAADATYPTLGNATAALLGGTD